MLVRMATSNYVIVNVRSKVTFRQTMCSAHRLLRTSFNSSVGILVV